MSSLFAKSLAAAAIALISAGAAHAGSADPESSLAYAGKTSNGPASAPAATPGVPAALTAFGTKARVALSYSGLWGYIRSVGVASVSHPSTGVYCIVPSVALNYGAIYPMVSVEWNGSRGNALLAFWRDTSINHYDCGLNALEVQTFDFDGGGLPVLSDNVAFDLLVE